MSSSLVLTSSGGYLKAMAQRGARDVAPSWRWSATSSTLTTMPSISWAPVVAVLPVVGDELLDRGDRRRERDLVGRRQAPGAQHGVRLALPLDVEAAAGPDAVDEHAQRPARRDLGVLLAQRPGGRVAGVGEGRLARLDEAGVEVGEGRGREEDLPADLDELRHVVVTAEPLGHALMVRTLLVTSSPVRPSPRVSARTRRPFS